MASSTTPEQLSQASDQYQIMPEQPQAKPSQRREPAYSVKSSRQFVSWLVEHNLSLACTTYQSSRLILFGRGPNKHPAQSMLQLVAYERLFARSMGLFASPERFWLSTLFQIWRLDNILEPGQVREGFDRRYLPTIAYTTGDLDTHDIAVDRAGRVIFVNTLYSCLATLTEGYSFEPIWHPPFITKLAAEDRCHLNGLAMKDGEAAYVTALSRSDITAGWRDRRHSGGVVVDVASGEIVLGGLSMPHSPRWYNDRLWLLESGTGYLGYVDLERGRFEPVTFCPGYLRGLAFHNRFAIVGLSKPRETQQVFHGLALGDNLAARDAEPHCGIMVIDLESGDIVHWLQLDGEVTELYDVAVLPGVTRPMVISAAVDEIRRVIHIKQPSSS